MPVLSQKIVLAHTPKEKAAGMNSRRGFLSLLGGAAAALVLDPERALWVPGKKLISIPETPKVVLSTSEMIAAQLEAIRPELKALMFVAMSSHRLARYYA